ncbi:MAG: Uncharacterized protein XD54_1696 [Thermococcus sibiricus]|uniref:Uncharacterized protein n=2 Tax=Thermococcaceae TaxID=2259 RepID=A0A117L125_9EURY|nr:MAG: Uncharacterized protein XD54_1696 [Thermococcus sibiricus]KUK28737.1 MAG: Uncharacterized protein XD61_0726 [Thermococcus sp. 40_45]
MFKNFQMYFNVSIEHENEDMGPMRGSFPDQKTIKDSEIMSKVKQKEFLSQSKEVREYSKLESAIVIILGLIVIGFVLFVLNNYF